MIMSAISEEERNRYRVAQALAAEAGISIGHQIPDNIFSRAGFSDTEIKQIHLAAKRFADYPSGVSE